jgi:hypothetical protein
VCLRKVDPGGFATDPARRLFLSQVVRMKISGHKTDRMERR